MQEGGLFFCESTYRCGAMTSTIVTLVAALVGVGLGALLTFALLRARLRTFEEQIAQQNEQLANNRQSLERSQEELRKLTASLARAEERAALVPALEQRRFRDEATIAALNGRIAELQGQCEALTAQLEGERLRTQEKLALLEQARETMAHQFRVLASEILEDKAKRFTEQNRENLGQLLEPLRTQLLEFKGKVEEAYLNESKDRVALREQIKHLVGMSQQLSKDANELAAALKGSSKVQGNWGEMVLERILEMAGLRRGFEYEVQERHVREDGTRAQPDVVIHLPEGRRLIVDSKVSLVAYQQATSATDEAERAAAVAAHLDSVRAHIRGLSAKKYEELHGGASLDFVILFVPIEPAYMLALQADPRLWQEAWERNVLLVGPSTLLFVLRTVAHLWRQEQRNRNAQEIARRGAELYDKLVGFTSDLLEVGDRLAKAQQAYENARKKLSEGRGNVIRQAEMLKDLGVKPSKSLPKQLLDDATDASPDLHLPAKAAG